MQTILSLVEAEEGVAIVPASSSNLRSNGVQFVRLVPELYLDLIAVWPLGEPSAVLRTFLDFLNAMRMRFAQRLNLHCPPWPGSSHSVLDGVLWRGDREASCTSSGKGQRGSVAVYLIKQRGLIVKMNCVARCLIEHPYHAFGCGLLKAKYNAG
jgi:hypothetical protein